MRKRVTLLTVAAVMALWMLNADTQAAVHTEKVQYKHGALALEGYLAYDDSSKKQRPGVLVVHEWWGLNDHAKKKAEELAKHGYIAFAVDMYGEGKTTDHPKTAGEWATAVRQDRQLSKERFLAAHEVLRAHPLTIKNRIAAIGYCFGGFVVLSMAQEGVDLRGVVSFHGAFPAEKAAPGTVKAKILVCHGAEDPLIKPEQITAYQENLKSAGADWQFISYGGAKHSFTNPGADKVGMPALGYNPDADRRSWKAMLALFSEIFAD
jgi:dienelactone hydrolase